MSQPYYVDSEGRSLKLPQNFSSMTPADTQGVVRCMVSGRDIYGNTHEHTQRVELVRCGKRCTVENDQAKRPKGVPDGFIQWQMDTLTFVLTICAMKCSLEEYQLPSPLQSFFQAAGLYFFLLLVLSESWMPGAGSCYTECGEAEGAQ